MNRRRVDSIDKVAIIINSVAVWTQSALNSCFPIQRHFVERQTQTVTLWRATVYYFGTTPSLSPPVLETVLSQCTARRRTRRVSVSNVRNRRGGRVVIIGRASAAGPGRAGQRGIAFVLASRGAAGDSVDQTARESQREERRRVELICFLLSRPTNG